MKLKAYFSMPSLERYPKCERLAKWQAVHRQLLGEDAQYRKRHTHFLITIICLSCPLLAVYSYYFGVGLTDFVTNLWVIGCVTAAIIGVVWRHLRFMNQRIGVLCNQVKQHRTTQP